MFVGLLANLGVGIVSRFLSSLLATSFPIVSRTGPFDSKSEAYLDNVSMTNRKTFPDVPSKFHVSGQKLGSRLSIPPGLGTNAG